MVALDFIERWNWGRFSSLFIENTTKNFLFEEKNALQFFFGSIIPKRKYELTEDLIETYKKYTIVSPGDIILNGLNLNYDFVSQRIALVKEPGIITSAYTALRLRNKKQLRERYYNYLFKAMDAQKIFHGMGNGIRLTLSFKDLKNYILPVPPRPEQDQIVRFLDWKVSSINKLINIKRKEIIELKSLKRSVVNHVVTHGLNSDVVMKNSGVGWLGKIPAHWEVLALKRMCSMKSGDNLTNLEIVDNDGYKVYGGNGIRGFFHRFNCENECVLIGRQGALCGNVHLVTERVWATDHAVITKAFGNISTKYLYYLLMAMNLNQYGQSTAAQPGISVGVIKNLSACLPPRIEQDQIVTYLETTNENYDKVAQIIDAKITTLSELKARLISDVVTGKIDVRGIEIPEYEFAEETNLAWETDEQNYEDIKEEEK